MALSQAVHELAPIREIILEIQRIVLKSEKQLKCRSCSKAFEECKRDEAPKSAAHEGNNARLKFATELPRCPQG